MEVNRVEEHKLPFLLLLWLSLQLLAWRILHWDNESRLFSFIFNLHSLGGLVNRGSLSYLVFSSRDGVKLRKDTRPTTLATYQTKRKIKTETTESSLVKISHHPTVKSNPSMMRGLFVCLNFLVRHPNTFCLFISCVLLCPRVKYTHYSSRITPNMKQKAACNRAPLLQLLIKDTILKLPISQTISRGLHLPKDSLWVCQKHKTVPKS